MLNKMITFLSFCVGDTYKWTLSNNRLTKDFAKEIGLHQNFFFWTYTSRVLDTTFLKL